MASNSSSTNAGPAAKDPSNANSKVQPNTNTNSNSSSSRIVHSSNDIPLILPHEKVFPIQIGNELFRLSGASISSDAPSYFSAYFLCQLESMKEGYETAGIRTLYIDRDPVTFRDISRHLQGYHISPRDGSHFVKLFADAQFYQLPKLIDQLYEESIYISIGGVEFQVPREIFSSPGDSPNYFTLGFAFLFSSPNEVFPGLSREGLLRPPSIMPPSIPNRSPTIFGELIHMLRGYPLHIRNAAHRAELLRDCRYFLFRGLEQKLIPHNIVFNLQRQRDEITIRLEDIRQPGLSVAPDPSSSLEAPAVKPLFARQPSAEQSRNQSNSPAQVTTNNFSGWVNYARQYVDDRPYELILEIGNEWTLLYPFLKPPRAEFFGDGKTRLGRLLEVVANKLNLPITQPLGLLMSGGGASSQPASPGNSGVSEERVKCALDGAAVILDGREVVIPKEGEEWDTEMDEGAVVALPPRKRRRGEEGAYISGGAEETWVVSTGLWRLRVQSTIGGKSGVECALFAVKLDAYSGEVARNQAKNFLEG